MLYFEVLNLKFLHKIVAFVVIAKNAESPRDLWMGWYHFGR